MLGFGPLADAPLAGEGAGIETGEGAGIETFAPAPTSALVGEFDFWARITTSAPAASSALIGDLLPLIGDITSFAPAAGSALRMSVSRVKVFAEVDLNDRGGYFGGYKAPWVLKYAPIRRGLSDRTGQITHMSFGATLSDTHGFFRGMLADAQNRYFTNRPIVQRMIDDEARRREEAPRIVANGYVTGYAPMPDRKFSVTGHDWLKKKLQRRSPANESWQPRISADDFPNANNAYQQMVGRIIPIIYGRITDTNLLTPGEPTSDQGDGQMPVIYVGDEVINGVTYATGLIAAHHCAYLEAGFWPGAETGVNLETDPDWLTPRNATAWAAAGFTTPWTTRNGKEFFVIWVKGAAGAALRQPIDEQGGNTSVTVNVWGRTTTGDETGQLLTDGFDIYLDFLANYVAPKTPWTAGQPLTIPRFLTVNLPLIDACSFRAARTLANTRLEGGYPLDFAIGANNESWSMADMIAEFNRDLDAEHYFNRSGQYCLTMEPTTAMPTKPALTDVIDIVDGTFGIGDDVDNNFFNVVPFRHTFDYVGRMQQQLHSDWRSLMSGVTEVRHETSILRYDQERVAPLLEFKFIRGKNRVSDSDYYTQGTLAANDIVARWLNRFANPRRTARITVPLTGTHYELGTVFPITAIDGIGSSGWEDRNVRVFFHELHPSENQVLLDVYDIDLVMENAES